MSFQTPLNFQTDYCSIKFIKKKLRQRIYSTSLWPILVLIKIITYLINSFTKDQDFHIVHSTHILQAT